MSTRRLGLTLLAMTAFGLLLAALGPDTATLRAAFAHPQRVADAAGPDVLVLAWAGALAWLVWGWGLLGLLLTAVSAVPGLLGAAARALLTVVLPAGARRAAAVALGIGLGVGLGAPALASAAPSGTGTTAAPDWPVPAAPFATPSPPSPPDWPPTASPDPATGAGDHVVVRGDCLWDIAADRLTSETGRTPTDGETAAAVRAWWTANAAVIGSDPDLLLPGQVLHPPGTA